MNNKHLASTAALGVISSLAVGTLAPSASAETLYAVSEGSGQSLITFDSSDPTVLTSAIAISGFTQIGETIRGIDFRPATRELYALGSFGELYTLDTTSGALTQVGGNNPTPSGSEFGFDFNPVIDRIRVVSDTNTNLVYNPNTGGVTTVTPLFYEAGDPNFGTDPNVISSAYDRNVDGTNATQLYGIDTDLDALITQDNSAGSLQTVAAITATSVTGPMDLNTLGGFDISGTTGVAYIAVGDSDSSTSTLWTIDLATAEATFVGDIGQIGGGVLVTSFTAAPIPEPGSLALLALGGTACVIRRRRNSSN